jgi:hypothetical protein
MICRHGSHSKVRPRFFIDSLQTRHKGVIGPYERMKLLPVSPALAA